MKRSHWYLVLAAFALAAGFDPEISDADAQSENVSFAYPYGGDAFRMFVQDSYSLAPSTPPFEDWLKDAYANGTFKFPDKADGSLDEYIDWKHGQLESITDVEQRATAEKGLGGDIFRLVKATIPKFSLDRGFEFTNVVSRGERQCLLQSVLVAGLLQKAGVDAGTVMVYLNERSEESNNGHAVTLVKLANGKDVLVDCSDPQPYAHQVGLFVTDATAGTYRYVKPQYDVNDNIAGYDTDKGDPIEAMRAIRPLDNDFIRSQFEYYRGERAPGGWSAEAARTTAGLQDTATHLRASIAYCPNNPLPVYLLGRVLWRLGDQTTARTNYATALKLYQTYGYVPIGMREAAKIARL